jgi:hypothetical protein
MNFILVLSIGIGISFVSSVLVPRGIVFVWPMSHFKEEMDVRIQSHISGFQKNLLLRAEGTSYLFLIIPLGPQAAKIKWTTKKKKKNLNFFKRLQRTNILLSQNKAIID